MFDLATRIQPTTPSAAVLAGVPFDLQLAPPTAPQAYPYTSLINDTGSPQPGVEMLATYALALEGGLATAVVLSLFTDARAGAGDVLALARSDRRGWVGDEFMPRPDTARSTQGRETWGSLLWLLYSGKAGVDTIERAQLYAREALAWLVRDGIASRVDVVAQWVPGTQGSSNRLAVRPTIWQPDQVRPVYDVLWGTSVERWATK